MKKAGLFYSKKTVKTAEVAEKIYREFGEDAPELVNVDEAWKKDFESYSVIIAGTSTWFDGELPDYWDELVPEIKSLNLKGKKAAIFGLGNQEEYPDNFVDGIELLADAFRTAGATITGFTSAEGYKYNKSLAETNGQFSGLVIDVETQPELTDTRIKSWVEELKKEFS